jgi:glycerophosphoryl diester phosphodiesterase
MRLLRLREPDLWFDVGAFAYAHRGLWDCQRPENSLAAFAAAAASGVGCELDVRVTLDGRIVVFHDVTLQRMCGRPDRVDQLPFSRLRKISLPDGSPIPTLEEALEAIAGLPALIEIKIDQPGTAGAPHDRRAVEAVIGALKCSNAPAAVMSFDPAAMARFVGADGVGFARPIGQLIEPIAELGPVEALRKADTTLRSTTTYLAPHHSALEAVARAYPQTPLVTWTVRTTAELETARRFGAAPIFEGFSPALAKPA